MGIEPSTKRCKEELSSGGGRTAGHLLDPAGRPKNEESSDKIEPNFTSFL